MISIVVCSISEQLFLDFTKSLQQTIGLNHEIIRIDNKIAKLSISSAYNSGAKQAQYDYLCFVHEDVIFHTKDWGATLCDHFQTLKDVGVIGLAGSDYFCSVAHGWAIRRNERLFVNTIQGHRYTNQPNRHIQINSSKVKEVIVLDGFFLAVKKSIWQEFLFDESIVSFHGYDLTFSLRVATKYKNYFVPSILLTHLSEGNFSDSWYIANLYIRKRWRKEISKLRKRVQVNYKIETAVVYESLHNIKNLSLSARSKCNLLIQYFKLSVAALGWWRPTFLFIKFLFSISYNRCLQFLGFQHNDIT